MCVCVCVCPHRVAGRAVVEHQPLLGLAVADLPKGDNLLDLVLKNGGRTRVKKRSETG